MKLIHSHAKCKCKKMNDPKRVQTWITCFCMLSAKQVNFWVTTKIAQPKINNLLALLLVNLGWEAIAALPQCASDLLIKKDCPCQGKLLYPHQLDIQCNSQNIFHLKQISFQLSKLSLFVFVQIVTNNDNSRIPQGA